MMELDNSLSMQVYSFCMQKHIYIYIYIYTEKVKEKCIYVQHACRVAPIYEN